MRDETINQMISKCNELEQKGYKPKLDWMMKVIYRELCKKLKFDHMNKGYKCLNHNPSRKMRYTNFTEIGKV